MRVVEHLGLMKKILLASEHLDPRSVATGDLGRGVAYALTPGEGPCRNPKEQPNEDSLAVLSVPGGVAVIVADSHWGAFSGEALVKVTADAIEAKPPATERELADLLLDLETSYRASRPKEDRSETTLLAAIVRGSKAIWASIADSHGYAVSAREVRRLNADRPIFAGGPLPLKVFAERVGRDTVVDSSELDLAKGELLVVASDGIGPEDSGLEPGEIARELFAKGTLLERVGRLVERARRAPGGRDNIALVALDPAGI
jgi:serine/threonine protein phosphatase PrpC